MASQKLTTGYKEGVTINRMRRCFLNKQAAEAARKADAKRIKQQGGRPAEIIVNIL